MENAFTTALKWLANRCIYMGTNWGKNAWAAPRFAHLGFKKSLPELKMVRSGRLLSSNIINDPDLIDSPGIKYSMEKV